MHQQLQKISKQVSVSATLLKLAYRIGIHATLAKRASASGSDWTYKYGSGSIGDIKSLVSHMDHYEGTDWQKAVRKGCEAVLGASSAPSDFVFNAEDLLGMCARINSNAHAIVPEETPKTLGLFAALSQMNHSCQPNTTFSGMPDGAFLYCRALTDIRAGDALTISYVDLYQSRKERRELLKNSKFFDCTCVRCQSPLPQSIDALIEGFQCTQRNCTDGLLIEMEQDIEISELETASQTTKPSSTGSKKNKGSKNAKKASQSTQQDSKIDLKDEKSSDFPSTHDESSSPGDDESNKVRAHQCNKCGHKVASAVCDRKFQLLVTLFNSAAESYAKGGPIATEKAKKDFEMLLNNHCVGGVAKQQSASLASSLLLGEHHWLAFNASQKLANCCIRSGDVLGAIRALKRVANSSERILPPNEPECANYHMSVVDCVLQLEKQGKLGKLGIQPYLEMKRISTQSALAMRSIALGIEHPLTKQCKEVLARK